MTDTFMTDTFMTDTMTVENPSDIPAAVEAKAAVFESLESAATPKGTAATLDALRDVPITITVQLGHKVLSIGEILKLGPGSVIELDEAVGTPVVLTVRGVPFASGEVVVVNDHFAVRILRLHSAASATEKP